MERGDRASLATFLAPALATGAGDVVTLGEDAAQHARVRRLAVGERVRLTSGAGTLAEGEIARLAKAALDSTALPAPRSATRSPARITSPMRRITPRVVA